MLTITRDGDHPKDCGHPRDLYLPEGIVTILSDRDGLMIYDHPRDGDHPLDCVKDLTILWKVTFLGMMTVLRGDHHRDGNHP